MQFKIEMKAQESEMTEREKTKVKLEIFFLCAQKSEKEKIEKKAGSSRLLLFER